MYKKNRNFVNALFYPLYLVPQNFLRTSFVSDIESMRKLWYI
jgi:hypothetical protein